MKVNTCRSFVAVLSIFLFAALISTLYAQETQTFQGELVDVNPTAETLIVRNSAGEALQFTYNAQTEVSGGVENAQNLSEAKGSEVSIEYRKQEDMNLALRITIQSQ